MTLPLTPPQTVGPFFADSLLRDDSQTVAAQQSGERIRIEGRVVDGTGAPVPDAVVEIWQADAHGRYHHPADRAPDPASFVGWGRSATVDGGYWFATIKPGRVRGPGGTLQAPHLVMQVFARGLLDGLITRAYFADEARANEADAILAALPAHRRQTLLAQPVTDAGPRTYRFDIVLQGDGETVFFDLGAGGRATGAMADIVSLADAVAAHVHDGDVVALEGFTHLIPFAAGHEIIRQQRRDLTLVRMTPDLIYDQLIGMGCARKLVFSWGGNPGVGSLHRFRDAVENGWPRPLEIEEHSHAAMANAYAAGASGLPVAVFRGYLGSDLVDVNPNIRFVECPFTGERLAAVPALRPDVSIVHAQRADRQGNVVFEGIVGIQKEAVLAAGRAIVTVEEIVDELDPASPNSVVLPWWAITAVARSPGGALPSYAHGHYERDNAFYKAWDTISRDRASFRSWMDEHVLASRRVAP